MYQSKLYSVNLDSAERKLEREFFLRSGAVPTDLIFLSILALRRHALYAWKWEDGLQVLHEVYGNNERLRALKKDALRKQIARINNRCLVDDQYRRCLFRYQQALILVNPTSLNSVVPVPVETSLTEAATSCKVHFLELVSGT